MPRDPISQAAIDYLKTTYGIPEGDMWRVTVEAGSDRHTEITVRMIIPDSLPDRPRGCRQTDKVVCLGCGCDGAGIECPRHGTNQHDHEAPKRHPALAAAHAVQFTKGAGRGHVVGRGDATIVPLTPTVCQRADQSGTVCGEVIRWSEANGWYHVSDRALGVATHSPMPPPVAPGVPLSAARRTVEG